MFSKITTTIKSATMYKQEFLEVECTNGLSFCLLIDKFIKYIKKNYKDWLWQFRQFSVTWLFSNRQKNEPTHKPPQKFKFLPRRFFAVGVLAITHCSTFACCRLRRLGFAHHKQKSCNFVYSHYYIVYFILE